MRYNQTNGIAEANDQGLQLFGARKARMREAQPAVVVIAIAGPSGGGKTTLVQHVAALLDHATQVYFDDYEAVSTYPADMAAWIANGADPNAWTLCVKMSETTPCMNLVYEGN